MVEVNARPGRYRIFRILTLTIRVLDEAGRNLVEEYKVDRRVVGIRG